MSEPSSILVVTQSSQRYQQIISTLSSLNYEFTRAQNSRFAISKLKEHDYQLIISETDIGDIDAWRLVRMVRANLFLCSKETPFVLVSETHCDHIAQTTASAFRMNSVVCQDQLDNLPAIVEEAIANGKYHLAKQSVLIIEDDADIAEMASRILRKSYQVAVANDGREALDIYSKLLFDIVLLDVQLPEISGEEVLKQILEQQPKQAIVVMTAHGGTDLAESLLMNGAVDFISKPFKADQLRQVVAIAAQRENYLISNAEFEEKVLTIRKREEQYKQLFDSHTRLLNHLSTVVMELDDQGRIQFLNNAWSELTGYSNEETKGELFASFAHGDDGNTRHFVRHHLSRLLAGDEQHKKIEFEISTKSLKPLWVEAQLNEFHQNGSVRGITITLDNIDDRKKAELELLHLASHDTLTNLYNRHHFDAELKHLANRALSHNDEHCLLYLDLDHFKVINDSHGHHKGDQILKDVAQKLTTIKRENDICCRVGGDEFALLLPRTSEQEALVVAQRICDSIQAGHYQFDDRVYKISCSIGMTKISGIEMLPDTYLQQADIALYVAKKRGRNRVHVYCEADKDTEDFKVSVQWVHVLQKAIMDDHLILHFQPIYHAQSREVAYFESLVRLQVDGNLVMPGEFIPALERVEDINLLDHQVISKTLSMMSQYPVLQKVAINLSAQAFSDDNLLPLVEQKLKQYNVKAEQIIFEVTESASLSNVAATREMIQKLMQLGCEFSIDDFGTGFSTFSYLKQLPANCIKIDGSFVSDMMENPIDLALVKSISEVAKALNKASVAEFVENENTAVALTNLGVDYLQGYHLSRPLSIDAIQAQFQK